MKKSKVLLIIITCILAMGSVCFFFGKSFCQDSDSTATEVAQPSPNTEVSKVTPETIVQAEEGESVYTGKVSLATCPAFAVGSDNKVLAGQNV